MGPPHSPTHRFHKKKSQSKVHQEEQNALRQETLNSVRLYLDQFPTDDATFSKATLKLKRIAENLNTIYKDLVHSSFTSSENAAATDEEDSVFQAIKNGEQELMKNMNDHNMETRLKAVSEYQKRTLALEYEFANSGYEFLDVMRRMQSVMEPRISKHQDGGFGVIYDGLKEFVEVITLHEGMMLPKLDCVGEHETSDIYKEMISTKKAVLDAFGTAKKTECEEMAQPALSLLEVTETNSRFNDLWFDTIKGRRSVVFNIRKLIIDMNSVLHTIALNWDDKTWVGDDHLHL